MTGPDLGLSRRKLVGLVRVSWVTVSFALLVAATTLGCAGHSMQAMAPKAGRLDPAVATELDRLRAATRPFRDVAAAGAAGYPLSVTDCIVHASHGAMGFHHLNRAYVDDKLDVTKPEFLLYERKPDGTYQLNGVEFILPYRFYSRDSIPPVLMGQQLTREDNFKYWYLHVWAWSGNADGVFANFNHAVGCPAGSAKLYKPSDEP